MSRSLACVVLLVVQAGCISKASSSGIKTSQLVASISGSTDGRGTLSVAATLQLADSLSTFVELGPGDLLTAKSGTEVQILPKVELGHLVTYLQSSPGDEEDKSVIVSFDRGSGSVSAPDSALTLPAKFNLLGPSANAAFVRGKDAIAVLWDNPGKTDQIDVELDGPCIAPIVHLGTSDTGSLVITADELKPVRGREMATCSLTVTVLRVRAGKLDSAFTGGGSVSGIQSRRVSVKSGPSL